MSQEQKQIDNFMELLKDSSQTDRLMVILTLMESYIQDVSPNLTRQELRGIYKKARKVARVCYNQLEDMELDEDREILFQALTDPDFAMDIGADKYYDDVHEDVIMMTDEEITNELKDLCIDEEDELSDESSDEFIK